MPTRPDNKTSPATQDSLSLPALKGEVSRGNAMNNMAIILDNTKMVLGLDIRSLGGIFLMNQESILSIRKGNLEYCNEDTLSRFLEINDIVMHLSSIFTQSPGSLSKTIIFDNNTLYSLLCEQNIEREKVINVATYILEHYQIKNHTNNIHRTTIDQLTRHS